MPRCSCPLGRVCTCGAWQRSAQDSELQTLRRLLQDCRPYIEDASNDAERAYHDRGGPQYLSPMRLEVKARADALLQQIDAVAKESPTPPHAAAQPE